MLLDSCTLGIYIHVPFCKNKCNYCSFYSITAQKNLIKDYTQKVKRYIKKFNPLACGQKVDTIYFGGGTPNLIGTSNILEILNSIYQNYNVGDNAEVTVEVNPCTSYLVDFRELKAAGVNRISVGVQSIKQSDLEFLGRAHSNQDVISTVKNIVNAEITNISCDLILCTPNQSEEDIKSSVNFCKELGASHVSAYMLKYEEKTPLFDNFKNLELCDNKQAELYLFCYNYLNDLGFYQYEISNFSLPRKQSRHNLKYWNCQNYLGVGPSAHSLLRDKRFYFSHSFNNFLSSSPSLAKEDCSLQLEYIMLRLRLCEGLIFKDFEKRFDKSILGVINIDSIAELEKLGLLKHYNEKICLTPNGFLLSNSVINSLLS